METRAFAPLYLQTSLTGSTGTLAPSVSVTSSTTAAASTQFAGNAANNAICQIQITNTTTAWAYVNFGVLAETVPAATVASSYPVAPGTAVVVSVLPEVNAASVILGAAPGTNTAVIFTRGEGI